MIRLNITCFIALFQILFSFSQSSDLNTLLERIKNFELGSEHSIKPYSYPEEVLLNEIKFYSNGGIYKHNTKNQIETGTDSVFYYLNLGNFEFFNNYSENEKAAEFYLKAIDISVHTKNHPVICHAIRSLLWYQIWYSFGSQLENNSLLELYSRYTDLAGENDLYKFFETIIKLKKVNYKTVLDYDLNINTLPKYYKSWFYNHLAIYYHVNKNYFESSKSFNLSLNNIKDSNIFLFQLRERGIYQNISRAALEKGDFELSEAMIKKALFKHKQNKLYLQNKTYYLNHKGKLFERLKVWDSAYFYLSESANLRDELNQQKMIFTVQELNKKFETAEKEKQILIEQQQKKKNRNIAYALGILLLFGGITFSLIQKNTKRKQLLAEQQKELQTQKLTTVLKEQELTAIDAMIEGQEKERQQIANDLHDELGGLMATLKLHFNALQEKPNNDLFGKTENLLDKAYQKVRSVAHTNNSGVMANKGLLKALNEMAETTSQSGKLSVEVVDFGLEKRLENSLELTIFRIVQELLTNVIKHAQASHASVHITQHDNSLNIMVEDNGKGFNTNKIAASKGMGIHSIDKRIDNLGGQVTIDSAPKKGTTVIIDIPI